jgi:hypothetical protein
MRGGVRIQQIAIDVHSFVNVTNIINHTKFGGCMLRGLVSAHHRMLSFPWEAEMQGPITMPCATALARDDAACLLSEAVAQKTGCTRPAFNKIIT